MNKYQLTDEVKEKYKPVVMNFIAGLEVSEFPEEHVLELTDTELNAYTLWKLLEELGYEKDDIDTNGWQMDFWITMKKVGFKDLDIQGTGITFELKLTCRD